MPVDKLLVKQRLALISRYVGELEELAKLPKADFLDIRTAASAESFLRRSLEAVFDIGRHILAKSGGANMALEYKGIAQGLADKGIVSGRLKQQLMKMAGYRNRLVHLYHQVSEEELYEIIRNDLKDLKLFVEQVMEYLARK
ncbi:MAG: type VII toxin-antitoxin system HepT family RNase toxin [Bacillota bacterium]